MHLTFTLDPMLDIAPWDDTVDDFDEAVEAVQAHENWIHDTTDEASGTCDTILMWDEDTSTFTLYIELKITGMVFPVPTPQIDTIVLTTQEA